jgi:general secretion pathway protein G
MKVPVSKRRQLFGFTLIEMLVVVAIMATLAAVIAPNLLRRADDAKIARVSTDLQGISSALDMYKLDNFTYPSADQGLMALVEKPNGSPEPKNWKGYLKGSGEPKDPWGNEYYYSYPGEHGVYDVYSLGADGQPGGEGPDADIGTWTEN